jgi:SPP1 gp7 family putative phage head morphogenesis protein
MRFHLAAIVRRTRNSRQSQILVRDIIPPAVLASNLYVAGYKPVVSAWSAAVDRLVDEYERTLATMVTDSPADLQAALEAAGSTAERLFILLDAALRDWTINVERWHREKWRAAILSATGVDLKTLIGPGDVKTTLERILAWNVSLVRDVNAEAQRRMSSIIFAGLNERRPAAEVARDLRQAVGMTRARAQRIASDQLAKLTSSLADERRRQAGISTWKWRWSHKLHGRKDHIARDGKIFTDETAPEDLPGQLPFCGCRSQSLIDLA